MEFIRQIIALFFPERDDHQRVRLLSTHQARNKLLPTDTGTCIALSSFKDPDIKASIHELKFHDNQKAAVILATLLTTWLKDQNRTYLLIPIPLAKERKKERGYNQVTRVIKNACKELPDLTYNEKILTRPINTTAQTELNRQERRRNLKGAFTIQSKINLSLIRDQHILLLDDVVTTGSTLREAKSVLEELPVASITTVALSH